MAASNENSFTRQRAQNLLGGIVCLLVCAAVIFLIYIDQHGLFQAHQQFRSPANPRSNLSRGLNYGTTATMPVWMAVNVAILFGLVGLVLLFRASGLPVSESMSDAARFVFIGYLAGFVAAACITSVLAGQHFVDFPLIPAVLNSVVSWIIWGIFILVSSLVALGCLIGLLKIPFRANAAN